jgi:serine/threonine protein kinase
MKSRMAELKDPTDTLMIDQASKAPGTSPNSTAPKHIAHYDLRREIGRGALSVVYEAQDTRSGQDVALKVLMLPASLTQEETGSLIARFEREARTASRLSHPNLVGIYEIGTEQSRHFLAMEYLKGQTLRKRMSAGMLTPQEAVPILTQIAGALDAVHQAGVTHRDVKPTNIMLLPDGAAKLLDFGIAQSAEETTSTHRGIIVGSPSYMAPEQIKGETGTKAADIWALGVLGYEMLTRHLPFTGPNAEAVMSQILHQGPAAMPRLPLAVQKVLRRVLDKQPAQRYPTASAFVQALKFALPGQAAQAPQRMPDAFPDMSPKPAVSLKPAVSPKPAVLSKPASPRWLPGAALLCLFLLGFFGAVVMRIQASSHAPKEAGSQGSVPIADQSPARLPVPPPALQSPNSQAPISQAPTLDSSPVASFAPAVSAPLKAQSAPRSHSAASLKVPTLPMPHSYPVMQAKQAVVQAKTTPAAKTVAIIKTVVLVPVQTHRPIVNRKQAADQYVPAPTSHRQARVQIASQQQRLAQRNYRAEATQNAVQAVPAPSHDQPAAAQSTGQSFTLPSDGGSYDLEAEARSRKSAWSQEGAASNSEPLDGGRQ